MLLLGFALFAVFRLAESLLRHRGAFVPDVLVSCGSLLVLVKTVTDIDALVMLIGLRQTAAVIAFLAGSSAYLGAYGSCFMLVLACSALPFVLFLSPRPAFRLTRPLLLILSPWFAFNAGQALWCFNHPFAGKPQEAGRATAPAMSGSRAPSRVVWLIFDELDQHLAFDNRPAGVRLPEFDSFRAGALASQNASSPAGNTLESIPSLITGRTVVRAMPDGPGELRLTFDDAEQGVWSRQDNVFLASRRLGFTSALAGWYHPYCTVLADSLTDCFSASGERWSPSHRFSRYSESVGFWKTLLLENEREFSIGPSYQRFDGTFFSQLDRRLSSDMRAAHLAGFLELREKALAFLENPKLSFVCIHVPVPHGPGIFDRERDVLTLADTSNYLDNLELADLFLGSVRQTLTKSGAWDDATVLVTSDHPYRREFWSKQLFWTTEMAQLTRHTRPSTVPFLLKLPRQKAPASYAPAFNTVLTRDLLLTVMRGEIRTASDASDWLDHHRTPTDPLLICRNRI